MRVVDLAPDLEIDPLRCAPFHEASGADPVGTAGAYDGFLCVEVPLPWGPDIADEGPFAALDAGVTLTGADGRTWRPQGLVPTDPVVDRSPDRPTLVLAFDTDGTPGPYRRRAWRVRANEVEDLARAVLRADDDALGRVDPAPEAAGDTIDLLVCTHGRRDVCCGGSGSTLFAEAEEQLADLVAAGELRLWRTSHTGGHRFAPTALSFPDGYAWAHLDAAAAAAITRRDTAPGAPVLARCRGASSVAGAPAQVADRAGLAEWGWAWAAQPREITVVGFDRATLTTTLEARSPSGALRVTVGVERHIPRPTCGQVPGPEYQTDPVWTVLEAHPIEGQ